MLTIHQRQQIKRLEEDEVLPRSTYHTWLKQQDEMIEKLLAEVRAKDAALAIAVEALKEISNMSEPEGHATDEMIVARNALARINQSR